MNLPVIFSKVGEMTKALLGNSLVLAKKRAPELMIGSGVILTGVVIAETVKSTNKTNDILETKEQKIEQINQELEVNENYTMTMANEDMAMIRRNTRWLLIRTWLPVVATEASAVILILKGFGIIHTRFELLGVAYNGLQNQYDRLYGNVAEAYGKDQAWHLANDLHQKREEDETAAPEGEPKAKQPLRTPNMYVRDVHSEVFDQLSDRWQRFWTPDQVWDYLVLKEQQLNDKLQIQKHLYENEAREALGLPKTEEGALFGWIITRTHPKSRVSFGLDDIPEDIKRDFLSETINENIWLRLHFNVDGMIYNLMDQVYPRRARRAPRLA